LEWIGWTFPFHRIVVSRNLKRESQGEIKGVSIEIWKSFEWG
jgi:hypothetical protein